MTGVLLPQGAGCARGWLLTQHQGEVGGLSHLLSGHGCTALGTLLWWGCPVHGPLLANVHSPGQLQQRVPKCSPSPSSAPGPLSEGMGPGRASAEVVTEMAVVPWPQGSRGSWQWLGLLRGNRRHLLCHSAVEKISSAPQKPQGGVGYPQWGELSKL